MGPTVRGEYAAVISWFGVLLLVGEVGQSAAVCFYVARDPRRARGYVATSRTMMLVTGALALAAGLVLAPVLAHGNPELAGAYRIAFAGSVIAFIGTSYTFALQAQVHRAVEPGPRQPAGPGPGRDHRAAAARPAHLGYRHRRDDRDHDGPARLRVLLVPPERAGPGRARPHLVRPLARYGLTQLAAVTPATVNSYLDQLVLSQLVPPADLGRYAIAVSVTLVPVPLVSAIGNVAFPRLAARRTVTADGRRLQLAAAAASAAVAAAILLPIAASAYWLIPAVFGPAYRGAVPLLWILTPGGIFLACGQVVGDLLRGLGRPGLVATAQGRRRRLHRDPARRAAAEHRGGSRGHRLDRRLRDRARRDDPLAAAAAAARTQRGPPIAEGRQREGRTHADRDRRADLAGLLRGQHHRRAAAMGHDPVALGSSYAVGGPYTSAVAVMVRNALPALDERAQRRVVRAALDAGCEIVINLEQRLMPGVVRQLRRNGIKVALWFPDALLNMGRQLMLLAPYDAVFVKEPHLVDRLRAVLDLPLFYLPEACNPRWHRPLSRPRHRAVPGHRGEHVPEQDPAA